MQPRKSCWVCSPNRSQDSIIKENGAHYNTTYSPPWGLCTRVAPCIHLRACVLPNNALRAAQTKAITLPDIHVI
eukprot:357733-Chlamydomonas_euryale.AAC.7